MRGRAPAQDEGEIRRGAGRGAGGRTRAAGPGERGSILIIGLVAAFVATLLAIALFELGAVQSRASRETACVRRSLHAAEAGLQRAYLDIERASPGSAMHFSTLAPAGGGGTLSTGLSRLGAGYTNVQFRAELPDTYSVQGRIVPGTGPRVIRLVSTGSVPDGCLQGADAGNTATVQADLTRHSTPLGAAFVGRDFVQMTADGAFTDSYNSFAGTYATSSCPQYDADGNATGKVVGCGGSLWSDGAAPADCGGATGAVCIRAGATVFGSLTASSNGIYVQTAKNRATGAIWGDVSYDPADSGSLTCTQLAGCVDATDPSKSIVQGAIVKGAIPPIQLADVTTCPTDPSDVASAAGYTSLGWLNSQVTVKDESGTLTTCAPAAPFCQYDDSTGVLRIDGAGGSLVIKQGQYCLNAVSVASPTQLLYDAVPANVRPVQLNVRGPVRFGSRVFRGTSVAEHESDPWLFQILSSCSGAPGGPCEAGGIEMKIGVKARDGSSNDALYGYLYAPRAPIKLNDTGDLFGAAVGSRLTFDRAGLHFDQALLNLVEVCPTCAIPAYLSARPADVLVNWKRCVAPPSGECS